MVDQRSKGAITAEAEEALRLLNGPVFGRAYDEARRLFIDEWIGAETVQHRELCWSKVAGLDEVQRQLRRIIGQGEHASRSPDAR